MKKGEDGIHCAWRRLASQFYTLEFEHQFVLRDPSGQVLNYSHELKKRIAVQRHGQEEHHGGGVSILRHEQNCDCGQ